MSEPSRPSGGWVPFPNLFIDRIMPRLTDTEWRVLCVIVRQTFGWHDRATGRRRFDRISNRQFKRRTGRESAAISRAIDALARSGLILVQDIEGKPLQYSSDRRRSHSHLWFGLNLNFMSGDSLLGFLRNLKRNSKSENNKTTP